MSSKFLMRVYGIFTLVMTVFLSFSMGIDAVKGDWRDIVFDAIMIAFWLFLVVFAHTMILKEAVSDVEFKNHMRGHKNKLDELISELKAKADEHQKRKQELEEGIHEIILSVVPKKQQNAKKLPTKTQQNKIREQFEKRFDGITVKFHEEKNGKLGIEITEKKASK